MILTHTNYGHMNVCAPSSREASCTSDAMAGQLHCKRYSTRNRSKNTTLLASMMVEGTVPCLAVEGAITSAVFAAYVEQVLTRTLRAGQVVLMDNLSAHKGKKVRKLVEEQGTELLYLPPYSPDPIEEAFAKIKNLLHKAEA
jgi:hypothetical protein